MGVCLDISSISDSNAGVLLEHPRLIWNIIFPQHANMLTLNSDHPLASFIPPEPYFHKKFEPEAHIIKLCVGEYWHGLHYLLCNEVWSGELPHAFMIDGGEFVGEVDVGYGPARIFTSEEVTEIAKAIQVKTRRDLTRNFDSSKMLDFDIYPQIWDESTALPTCLNHFEKLQVFLNDLATHKLGMVVYLTQHD